MFALLSSADAPAQTQPRTFAPGVETTIPIEIEPEEAFSVHPMVEIRSQRDLAWQPKLIAPTQTLYSQAEEVRFSRDIWQLEFAFKPLRMIWIDLPQPNGEVRRELVWYLVYRVTNRGNALSASFEEPGVLNATKVDSGPVEFVPQFVLEAHDLDASGDRLYRAYLDRLLPAAVAPIRQREVPSRTLHTNVSISEEPIPVSTDAASEGAGEQSVWGVATWVGLDPEIDFFSVYVRGLSNAYKWEDPEGAYQPGKPAGAGREFYRKVLQLNFWRPGDQFSPHESEVRFGVAPGKADLYDVAPGVAYRWIYR